MPGFLLLIIALLPPVAQQIPFEITTHGHTRIDNYYWLRDKDNPEVLSYLEAENVYADSIMALSAELIDTISEEIISRISTDEASVPYLRNNYWYWHEYKPGMDYQINMRRSNRLESEAEILLDENILAESYGYFAVEPLSISPDNNTMAYAYDTTGGHWNTLVFQDISSGDTLDIIHNAAGDLAWAADSRMVFFGLNDETGRTDRIMRKTIGCDDMVCVYTESDPTFWPWVSNSTAGEWIFIGVVSTLESEYRVVSAETPREEFTLIHPRTEELEYYVTATDSMFYIDTNLHGENFSVMQTSAFAPSIENWESFIPYNENRMIEDIDIFENIVAITVRENGQKQLLLADKLTGEFTYADLGTEMATFYTSVNYSEEADSIRLVYTSLTTPWSTIVYDMNADTVRILKTQFVGENFDRELYESRRVEVPASDGAIVPVNIVYRKDLYSEGENPLLLYGYGAYGSSLDPMFSSSLLSLLDRGFVYADAQVRGGSEMGRAWYDGGRTVNKMNTFTDFIACAEYLKTNNYCDSDKIFAMGESAGGLLVGAVTNMRPDLWRGVVAGVPFVDALTTMLDPTIPLTTNEYDEWGNPTESYDAYQDILAYSPVDNVAATEFPAMYVFTGLNDSQVAYWEPAKWVAKIREMNIGTNPLIFRINMGSGHGGDSGRFGWVEDQASKYAFLINQAQ